MSSYKTDQRRVSHAGREFHFVSYEGVPANVRTGDPAVPAAWCLVTAGKRWSAIPQRADETDGELDSALRAWLESNLFTTASPVRVS